MFQIIDLLKKIIPEIPIIYINKEDLNFNFIKNYENLVNYAESQRISEQKHAIFIDEIQEIEEFERALRHFNLSENWDIYCTGSNAKLLSGELATYLSGRYIEITIYSLSFSEFLLFHNFENTFESFLKYVKYGGLPYLTNLQMNDEIVFDYLKNIYITILYKDIISRYKIRNTDFLERLILYVADNIGNIFSAKKITDYLKSQKVTFSNNIVLEYLTFLQNAFFISKIKRNDLKGKKILEIGEKYYFQDIGIRNAIISYKQNDLLQIIENIVLHHLLILNYNVTVGRLNEKEIDFVCDRFEQRLYIQVTISLADPNVKNREIGNLLEIKDNYKKIIVTLDEFSWQQEGIEIINIRKFLTEYE